jgi:hypothetical protein
MYTSMMRKAMLGDTATLNLDFTTGTMPTAVTFTRADSTARATYIDASGYVTTVASAGDPRFDYAGGVKRGLLIEGQTQNVLFYSQDVTQASRWTIQSGIPSSYTSVSATGGTAPDNTNTANLCIEGTANNSRSIYQSLTAAAGTYTASVWVKAGTGSTRYIRLVIPSAAGNFVYVTVNISTGVVTQAAAAVGTASTASATVTPYPGSWYRIQLTGTLVAALNFVFIVPLDSATASVNTGDYGREAYLGNGSTFLIWGAQLEAGSSASSYIPTTTSALTRLADDAVIRSTAWTGLYSKPGTIVVEYYRGEYGAGDRSVLGIDTAVTKHIHLKHANASAASGIYNSAGSGVANKIAGNVTGLNKAAFNWSSDNPSTIKYALNGNATVVSGSSDIGATLGTWMTIGSASTTGVSGSGTWEGCLNNSIKSVKYYSVLLSDADMIAKTT